MLKRLQAGDVLVVRAFTSFSSGTNDRDNPRSVRGTVRETHRVLRRQSAQTGNISRQVIGWVAPAGYQVPPNEVGPDGAAAGLAPLLAGQAL